MKFSFIAAIVIISFFLGRKSVVTNFESTNINQSEKSKSTAESIDKGFRIEKSKVTRPDGTIEEKESLESFDSYKKQTEEKLFGLSLENKILRGEINKWFVSVGIGANYNLEIRYKLSLSFGDYGLTAISDFKKDHSVFVDKIYRF